jgi:hypothetical protein
MPVWIPIIGAIIVGVVAVTLFVLSGHRERAKSKSEAVSKFRAAFADELTQIGKVDADSLMKNKNVRIKHDVAIHEFRHILYAKYLTEYDTKVEKFNQCRENLVPAIIAALSAINAGKKVDESGTEKMKVALNELLAFADKSN